MAFSLDNFNNVTSGKAAGPKFWAYNSSADAMATIVASGYFNSVINSLQVNDLIYVVASDAIGWYKVTSTTTNVTLDAFLGSASKTVTVTAAEMLALAATPKELVAAPGTGKVLRFNSVTLFLDYGGTAYTVANAGDDLSVRYTGGAGAIVSQTLQSQGFLDATADAYLQGQAVDEVGGDLADHANKSLVLDNIGIAEFTNGNSPVYVVVNYDVLSVPF